MGPNTNQCLTCIDNVNFQLINGTCVCRNPRKWNNNGMCSDCDVLCGSCLDGAPNSCITCLDTINF